MPQEHGQNVNGQWNCEALGSESIPPRPVKRLHWILPVMTVLALSACSSYSTSNPAQPAPVVPAPPAPPSSAAVSSQAATLPASSKAVNPVKTVSVSIRNFAFTPSSLRIAKGTKVVWTNNDAVPHRIASNGEFHDSNTLNQGESYSFTFKDAGTFPYHCAIHPSMQATIEVTE